MEVRIETEKKYFCDKPDLLINRLNELNFKLVKTGSEIDEYFTDIDSKYIKDRICLRIRMTDEEMIVTHKGKSSDKSSVYSKMESEFTLDSSNHDNIKKLFSAIGYYLYTTVNKKRSTYTFVDTDCIYNVMIDTIKDVGGFVEYEILCNTDIENQYALRIKLDEFVKKFSDLNLDEADLPYRDFVANDIYSKLLPKNGISGIYLNINESFNNKIDNKYYLIFKLLKQLKEIGLNIKVSEEYKDILESLNIDYIDIDTKDNDNDVIIDCDDLDKTIQQLLIIVNLIK